MKRNSLSHVIRKMQIKTVKQHTWMFQKSTSAYQMLVRLGSHRNSHWLLMGTQTGPATLEGSLALSTKLSISLAIQSNNCAPWYLPKGAETLCLQKNMYTEVYSSFILNCKTWKQLQYSLVPKWKINGGTSRQWNIV